MGSEYYAYFVVESERVSSAELEELAQDAGAADLPHSHQGSQVVARLEAASKVRQGEEMELWFNSVAPAPVRPRDRREPARRSRAGTDGDTAPPRGAAQLTLAQAMAPAPRSTGMPGVDAQHDFLRARRRATLARLAARLRTGPDDVGVILPYEEVIAALGFESERALGLQVVPLESIVGTVDRARDFDRRFRPTSGRVRGRWEQIAAAMRRGESMPPVDLLRVGEIHFVRDGHHRVSVARALGRTDIDAYVTEVITRVPGGPALQLSDLGLKSLEREFFERVPLPSTARTEISLSDPWDYAELAESVEAWGFRAIQDREALLDRGETARLWLENEYRPVVAMLREADLVRTGPRRRRTCGSSPSATACSAPRTGATR